MIMHTFITLKKFKFRNSSQEKSSSEILSILSVAVRIYNIDYFVSIIVLKNGGSFKHCECLSNFADVFWFASGNIAYVQEKC